MGKEIVENIFSSSGKDGFFDLTHVGTGERLRVQESWAKFYPKFEDGRDCLIAYLGELNILHDNISILPSEIAP